jgi:hypothetical protein
MKTNHHLRLSAMGAALLAVTATLCAMNLAHGETTAQYVRDGLLACWDGVENAGYGMHDDSPSAWVDLVGGLEIAIPEWVTAESNGFYSVSSTGTRTYPTISSIPGLGDNVTIEVVAERVMWRKTDNYNNLQPAISSPYGQLGYRFNATSGVYYLLPISTAGKVELYNINSNSGGFNVSKCHTYAARVTLPKHASNAMVVDGVAVGGFTSGNYTANKPSIWTFFNAQRADIRIYAIRVYSRRLTDDELASNRAVDVSRFIDGYVEDDGILEITWSPKRYGTPDPDYGLTRHLAANASLPVSCPPAWTNDAGDTTCSCTGWKLYDAGGTLLDSGTETAFTYVHPSPAAYRRLEWQWTVPSYRILAAADEGGSTSPAVQWVAEGDTATVTATPAAERGFYQWTNNVPSTVTASSATISFPVTAPMSLYATFAGLWHVSPTGDATAPRASFETGFPTIEAALAVATKGDTILLAPATYVLANAAGIAVTNGVRLVGVAGPDATVVAAKPNGTADSKLLKLVDGRVEGITFSNACLKTRGAAAAGFHASGASLVTNCVLTDFHSPDGNGYAVHLAGTTEVSDSVIRNLSTPNATAWNQLIAVYLGDSATVHDCVITNNQFRYRTGGAVMIAGAGAALRRSLVKGNTHIKVESQNMCFAAGVYISAGTLEDCVIDGNVAKGSSLANTLYAGGVCIAAANTVVRRCVISNNRAFGPAAAAGLYIAATGKTPYHDLLIIGNIGENGRAGGVLINKADAILAHSTIYGNTLPYSETGTPGAYVLAGTLTDSIVYGNGGPDTRFITNNVFKASNGTLAVCNVSCAYEASLGTGNVAGDPCLADPENGDYGLTLVSPGLDAGVAVAGVGATDLAGTARPQGAAVDMGCYEFAPGADPACAIAVDSDRIPAGGTAILTAVVLPAEGVSSYLWTVSDAQGAWTATTGDPTFRYTPSAPARAEITCTARWAGGAEATSRPVVVDVQPAVVHAALSGSHVWPYDTEAKAATNLQSAIDAVYAAPGVPGTVYVHGGVWGTDRGQDETQSHVFAFSTPIRLVGLGDAVLDGGNARRILQVNHPEAVVTNIAFTRAKSFNTAAISGAALNLVAGYATDCVITNCVETSMDGTSDALLKIVSGTAERFVVKDNSGRSSSSVWSKNSLIPVYVGNGTLRNSVITGNFFQDRTPGGAVSIVGRGVVEDCEISGNTSKWSENSYLSTGGVTVQGGGTLRRCRIINNTRIASGASYRACGGVSTYGGNATVEACVITNNVAGASYASCIPVAGVLVGKNAVFRNCLIANNRQTDTTVTLRTGGVYLADAGALENCTVYGNSCTQVTNSGIYQVAGTVTNCIAWGNGGKVAGVFEQHDMKQTGGSAGYSCFGEAVAGEGNISADPVFRKPAAGNFFVRHQSPCVHAGIAIDGLLTDIEGMPRSTKRRPTMGCYRFTEPFPTRLILR